MARFVRQPRSRRTSVPEVPYYAGEVPVEPVVGTRTTIEETVVTGDDRGALLWLLLIPIALLVLLSAYLLGRDDNDAQVTPTPSPSPVTTVIVPGAPAPAPPPVVINPPPVIVQQPPQQTQPPQPPQQTQPPSPQPTSS